MDREQILALHEWRCKHGHSGIAHYNCYLESGGKEERIAFFDIEASDLNAEFGFLYCWCIKPNDSDTVVYDEITPQEILQCKYDERIVGTLCEELKNYDRVVGHYSSRYDIPMARTRAIKWGHEFPKNKQLVQSDTWRMARSLLKLRSNRQNSVQRALLGRDDKTYLDMEIWQRARSGKVDALKYILDHCIADVHQLEEIYDAMKPYFRKTATSI